MGVATMANKYILFVTLIGHMPLNSKHSEASFL